MGIASAMTMFWQGTSMKPGKSMFADTNMYKQRFAPGLTAWPAVFLAQGLRTVEINKRANSKFCSNFHLNCNYISTIQKLLKLQKSWQQITPCAMSNRHSQPYNKLKTNLSAAGRCKGLLSILGEILFFQKIKIASSASVHKPKYD